MITDPNDTSRPAPSSPVSLDDVLSFLRAAGESTEATLRSFAGLRRADRHALFNQLNTLGRTLTEDWRWAPVLCDEPFVVLIENGTDAREVQQALFQLGCGYHNGDYGNLSREPSDNQGIAAIHVNQRGCLSLSFYTNEDLRYLNEHCAQTLRLTKAELTTGSSLREIVLRARSPSSVVPRTAGPKPGVKRPSM